MANWVSSPVYRAVVETLVAARREQGLTQRDMAARLGKPPSYVAKVELAERRMDIAEFILIAQALEVSPSTLFQRVLERIPS